MGTEIHPVAFVTAAPSQGIYWWHNEWDNIIRERGIPFNILSIGDRTNEQLVKLTRYGELYNIKDDHPNGSSQWLGFLNFFRQMCNTIERRNLIQVRLSFLVSL